MALGASKPPPQAVGDYDLVEKLAEGGMGAVYKGRHRQTGQIVAVKVLAPDMANNQVLLKRFENEFRAANKLNHPNIVRALDYGSLAGRPYLVMEFIDGESVGQRLEREGKLNEEEAVRIVVQAAEGLQEAHDHGLIHRDVKPDNLMLTRDGQVKLADLGLAKETEADMNLTRTGRGLGTPHFMSPEQFRNAKNADARCDIYSLGATLYMMVTGELPFKSCGPLDAWMKKVHNDIPSPRKLNPKLSVVIDRAIQRSMLADPKLRHASCREFIADLLGQNPSGNAAGSPIPAAPETAGAADQDVWYLVYKDDKGTRHTVKGTTAGIRRSLEEGALGDVNNVRASRSKTGNFEPVLSYAEFRDLTASLSAPSTVRRNNIPTSPYIPLETSTGLKTPVSSSKTPPPAEKPTVPHVPMETGGSSLVEGLKMLLLALVAMAVGMVAFYLMNKK